MNRRIAYGAALGGAALVGALLVAYGAAGPSGRAGDGTFTQKEEEAIRTIVRDYLIEHPDVLVDSLRAYSDQQRLQAQAEAKENARAHLATLLKPENGFVAGADVAKASVAVVELFDYHCGFCKRSAEMVRDLTKKDPAVKVVFRELPILREESDFAAELALAAREQGKYLDLHFALMDSQGVLTRERIEEIAEKQRIDFAALEAKASDPKIKAAIEESHRIAAEMGVDGTPTFLIASLKGDYLEVIPGFDPQAVADAIDEAKKAAKKAKGSTASAQAPRAQGD
jgi:protein-disulfide isomerase